MPIEFRVEDFQAAYKELESRGVKFKGETIDSGVCCQAFFEDPDGNTLAIHHRYARGHGSRPARLTPALTITSSRSSAETRSRRTRIAA